MPSSKSRSSSTGARHRDGEYGVIDDLRTTLIYTSLSSLLLSEKYSDMTISCGGREFKAHRAVVCTQSPFFDKALSSGFQESSTGIIDLPEDDPDVLERFLQFLYTGTYEDGVIPTWGLPSHVAMMSTEEIVEELNNSPGIMVVKQEHSEDECQEEVATTTPEPVDDKSITPDVVESADPALEPSEDSDAEGSAYQSSESDDLNEEPEEEYNEFYKSENDSDSGADPLREILATREGSDELRQHFSNIRQDLFLPLRLYIMADRYDVPALRLLARDRFYRSAEVSWKVAECFPSVVDELYSYTRHTDIALREIVCRLVATSLKEDEIRTKLEPTMRKHGDFAVDVMNCYMFSAREDW